MKRPGKRGRPKGSTGPTGPREMQAAIKPLDGIGRQTPPRERVP
jgi:hypothetical protein